MIMVPVKGLYDELAVKGAEYFAKLRFFSIDMTYQIRVWAYARTLHLSNLRLMLSAHPLEIEANIPKLIHSKQPIYKLPTESHYNQWRQKQNKRIRAELRLDNLK